MRLLFCVSICRDDRWATQDDNDFTPSMSTFRRLKWMRLDTPCQRLERNDGFDVENDFKGDRFELCSISNMISHISYYIRI